VVVAHRLSTILDADEIIVMIKGEVKERGTFDSLQTIENGIFKNLVKRQTMQNES
jgi:ABC-type multidrug transport system fused ATPase/permease subunit